MEDKNMKTAGRLEGWHRNTDFAVNLKTILRSDRRMNVGKGYQGVMRLDSEPIADEFLSRDAHYTFVETVPAAAVRRNPHVFRGRYISVTRRKDGSLHPNFRPLAVGTDFSVARYALGVYNEICLALGGLVGEGALEDER